MTKELESIPTKEPVTTSGWYERTDGSVGRYVWHTSRLKLVRVVASWADVASEGQ